ncbi:MAG TPA: chemotaxis response regulator protein-glutamate methylesterase [Methylovirgula sp.]|nr:chemotaxis response regulator protein-glutamate methylesterase [Methylovirgula sp.]
MKRTRVLVVDDSRTMRNLICYALGRDPEIEVVGQAADPFEARAAMKTLDPDVVTLDVEMPNMNGIDFLSKIMELRPTPVIMVSNLTREGTDATIKALELGAIDCVAKPMPGDEDFFADLSIKVKAAAAARAQLAKTVRQLPPQKAETVNYLPDGKIVAIGASTGGVEALITMLAQFPKNCPPTLIAQHMPGTFTKSFADRLDRLCAPRVCEAFDGAPLASGQIYLAPGSVAHLEVASAKDLTCRLAQTDAVNGHRPSVDVLFKSVALAAKSQAVGVILTGMGRDGAEGLKAMRQAGARTIGQDRATSLVYGMPRVAFELGAVEKQVPLERIGEEVLRLTNKKEEGSRECRSHLP